MLASSVHFKTPRKTFDVTLPKPMTLYEVWEFARAFLGVRRGPETVELEGGIAKVEFINGKQAWEE